MMMDDDPAGQAPTSAPEADQDWQNDLLQGLQLDEETIHSVIQQQAPQDDDEEVPKIDFRALDKVIEAQKPKPEQEIAQEAQPPQKQVEELNEEELLEAEDEFQSFLQQNSSVQIVNEHSMIKALDLPAAPEGYRYDMTRSPPELVKKKEKKKVSFANSFANTTPKAKPTEEQQVDLLRSNYSKGLTTNDTYNVPQRYNYLPPGTKAGNIAPCTNPATYVDISHFPVFFKTEDEAVNTYNQMAYQYKIQMKKHGVCRGEGGHVTKFSMVCQKRALQSKSAPRQGLQLKSSGLCDCPFLVQFKWKADRGGYVRCKKMNFQHTHHLEVKHKSFIKNENVIREIKLYVECMITPAQAHLLINKKFKIQARYPEVYSAYKQVKNAMHTYIDYTTSDTQQLLQLLEQMKKDNPKVRYAYQLEDPGENSMDPTVKRELKIDRMFIQTPIMAKYYQKYHDVVFMDATYNTNKHNLALAIISGISSEGKNIIMGIAFLARETIDHYQWLLKTLVDFNGGIEPKTFMTDFDSSMCGGIEATFKKTTHLLCQWHMMQNFKKHFVFLSKRKNASSKMLYNHIMDAIFTESPARFQQLQDIIFQSPDQLDESKLNYLRQLFQIKEKWASAHQPIEFTSGIHTIQRAESVNSQVKHKLTKKTSLKELFELILTVEKKVIEKTIVYGKNYAKQVIHHPLLKHIFENYSTFAFEQMFYQFMQSHAMSVVDRLAPKGTSHEHRLLKVCDDSGIGMFSVREMDKLGIKDKMQVIIRLQENQGYQVSCNCRYFWSFNLYCAHVFSVFNLLQIRTLEKFEPYSRWTKKFHASVYKDDYPELQIPGPPQQQPPQSLAIGDKTMALMQGNAQEPKRNADGVPVDSQQESAAGFNHAMFERAFGQKGASSGVGPSSFDKKSSQTVDLSAENPEEEAPATTMMIDTTKTRKQKQQENEMLEVTNYVAPGYNIYNGAGLAGSQGNYPLQLLHQQQKQMSQSANPMICTPSAYSSQGASQQSLYNAGKQLGIGPSQTNDSSFNQGSTKAVTVDLCDDQEEVKTVPPKPILSSLNSVPAPTPVQPGSNKQSASLVTKLIQQSQNALHVIQNQMNEVNLLPKKAQDAQEFQRHLGQALGLNSCSLLGQQRQLSNSQQPSSSVVPPPQLVQLTKEPIQVSGAARSQLAYELEQKAMQDTIGCQKLSPIQVLEPSQDVAGESQVFEQAVPPPQPVDFKQKRAAINPLPEPNADDDEEDYAEPPQAVEATANTSSQPKPHLSSVDQATAKFMQMTEEMEKAQKEGGLTSQLSSSLLKSKQGADSSILARQHKKVITTLQQQMQLERAKISQGQAGFKDHFKNVFN